MDETSKVLLRLCRLGFMCLISLIGLVCALTMPQIGMKIWACCLAMSVSYMCVLYRPQHQLMEFFILLCVMASTATGFLFSNKLFFIPILAYLFYGVGKGVLAKEMKLTAKSFSLLFKHKN